MSIKQRILAALAGLCALVLCATVPSAALAAPAGRTSQATRTAQQLTMVPQQATVTTVAAKPVIAGGVTIYPDPAGADPAGIVAGSDGALWYANSGPGGLSIGRITTAGKITHYTDPRLTGPFAIASGSDGALWFTNGSDPGSIGRMTTSGTLTFFDAPRISVPEWIAAGPDGALWFTVQSGGGYVDPAIEQLTTTGTLTTFTAPSISVPTGIAPGPDGAMWFVNSQTGGSTAGSIGRITTSGTVTDYTYPGSFRPRDITAGPDGSMWFLNGSIGSAQDPSSVERITTAGVVTDFANSVFGALGSSFLNGGGGLVEGPDGALWFIDYAAPGTGTAGISVVGRMTAGGAVTTYVIPQDLYGNEIARGPGNTLWFTIEARGIGRLSTLGFTAGPRLSGTPRVGKPVSCLFSSLNTASYTVRWLAGGAVIKGAASRAFTPAAAQQGRALSCSVTLKNAGGALTRTSTAVKTALGAALAVTGKPALSGAHKTGQPESVSPGRWTPAASSYTYQWYLGTSAVARATSARYTPPAGDRGKRLHCVVTAHKAGYTAGRYATSAVTLL